MSAISPQAHEQAALWAAKIDGASMTGADHQDFQAWLDSAPGHRDLLSRYCQLGADLEETLPALVNAGLVAPAPAASRPSRTRWWLGVAGLGAAAVLALGWWMRPIAQVTTQVATLGAQRQALSLADGTRVELNARTRLTVEAFGAERRVRLSTGQAFLQVAKDPAHPFVVETPTGTVQVTGTAFDVRCGAQDELIVTVTEGSVQVRAEAAPGAPVMLTPGYQLSASKGRVSVRTLTPAALDEALAWREGLAVFSDNRLDEALARFSQHHGRTLRASPEVASLMLGGRYRLDDLDGFLAALPTILPVTVVRSGQEVLLTASRHP